MRRLKFLAAILAALTLSPALSSAKPPRGGYNGIPSRYDPIYATGRRMNRYNNFNGGGNFQWGGVTAPVFNGGFGPGYGYNGGVFVQPVWNQWYPPIYAGPQFQTPIFWYNFQ